MGQKAECRSSIRSRRMIREVYTQLLKDALIAQGIEPTTENIKKASKQFQAANRGAVKTYHGSRAEWKGNKYLIADTDVKIPKFEM